MQPAFILPAQLVFVSMGMISRVKLLRSSTDAAAALGITAQAMSNKYNRDSFSAEDLVKVAAAAGYNLAFVRKRDGLMITFPAAGPAEAGQE